MKVVVRQRKSKQYSWLSGVCFALLLGGSSFVSAKVPQEGLQMAQNAEKLLAANKTADAIKILEDGAAKYPNAPAFQLRLAQVYDNNNELGKALFYYRKFVESGSGRGMEDAMARSSTLELMPQVKAEAESFAQSKNETTKPVAQASSKVLSSINVEKPDGTLIPLKGPDDLNTVISKGIHSIETPKPASATITPSVTPIIVNPQLIEGVKKNSNQQASKENIMPRPVDEDALIAQRLLGKQPNEQNVAAGMVSTPPVQESEKKLSIEARLAQDLKISGNTSLSIGTRITELPPSASIRTSSMPSSNIAFTKPDTSQESPKARSFFNTKSIGGSTAKVVVMNSMAAGVVTVSIVPEDEKPAEQAILMPGESKTIILKPDYYNFTANVSTTDYPPITLMNTQFRIQFQSGTQYTRRFDKENNEKVN